jgi:NAD(P)-dependent dehydrogenase (short-subunit alcohol dehydrogenase family)
MGQPDTRTDDGFEVQMQTNHLSHFLLTALCMPSLEACAASRGDARIVQHSSGARSHRMASDGEGHLKDEFFSKSEAGSLGGDAVGACFNRYHQTKLSNSVFAMALHEKLVRAGKVTIKSVVAEPGVSTTSLAENMWTGHGDDGTKFAPMMANAFTSYQSAADGAVPLMKATFAQEVLSGEMYMPCDANGTVGLPLRSMDNGFADKAAPDWCKAKFQNEMLTMHGPNRELLWKASEAATGVKFM